jgi:hypothetical protein
MPNCHICGKETEFDCEICNNFVCENCTVAYTQFNQIDYTMCKKCEDSHNEEKADEYQRQERMEEDRIRIKKIKNEKQRKYYYSEKAIEKRRLKKIELQKLREKIAHENLKTLSNIFSNIFNKLT